VREELFWKYPAFMCLVAAVNLVALFIALFAVQSVSAVSQSFHYAVATQDRVTATLTLLWACLAISFLYGACLRAIAVPAGWMLASWWAYLAFCSEHYPDGEPTWPLLLVPVVVALALAAISAWHGSKWATQRDWRDVF